MWWYRLTFALGTLVCAVIAFVTFPFPGFNDFGWDTHLYVTGMLGAEADLLREELKKRDQELLELVPLRRH